MKGTSTKRNFGFRAFTVLPLWDLQSYVVNNVGFGRTVFCDVWLSPNDSHQLISSRSTTRIVVRPRESRASLPADSLRLVVPSASFSTDTNRL